ncbi:UNVERIFIED_CONTAM: hypothetical protein Sradi_2481300 [Sesamum radiatum]|uniref:Uncharacterized protein n=1 Tax=Sesamum radiatum TaxID=300843 RepID=A0AAW2SJ94_SESRA
MSLGLPLLNPYLDKTATFNNGVNFAVASATTLDPSFYLVRGSPFHPFLVFVLN